MTYDSKRTKQKMINFCLLLALNLLLNILMNAFDSTNKSIALCFILRYYDSEIQYTICLFPSFLQVHFISFTLFYIFYCDLHFLLELIYSIVYLHQVTIFLFLIYVGIFLIYLRLQCKKKRKHLCRIK